MKSGLKTDSPPDSEPPCVEVGALRPCQIIREASLSRENNARPETKYQGGKIRLE